MRTLLVHQAEGVVDHGVSIAVSCNPTPSTPLGPTARVAPACGGESASGAEALWGRESKGGDRRVGTGGNRLDTEVGYGVPIGARATNPRAGTSLPPSGTLNGVLKVPTTRGRINRIHESWPGCQIL